MQAGTIAVGRLIFDGVEVLDACGPFEVFGTAGRLAITDAGEPVSRVVTVARSPQVVVARHGLRVVPDATLADEPPFDVLVVPGGVVDAVSSDTEVTGLVARRYATSRLTLSVCAGAFILGHHPLVRRGRALATLAERPGSARGALGRRRRPDYLGRDQRRDRCQPARPAASARGRARRAHGPPHGVRVA
jgi:putative intracellular protease/amidase